MNLEMRSTSVILQQREARPFVGFAAAMIVVAFGFVPQTQAKRFQNAYIRFDISDKWACTLESTEWVCRTSDPGLAEAIIILTAKEVGPSDSLSSYESYLNSPRTLMTKTGQTLQSSVYEVKQQTINNHPWVNGFHFGSEVINYYTRYLATIKERIAVLVTFSAHKLHYSKYAKDFFATIASLDVIASKSLWANGPGGAGSFGGQSPFGPNPGGDAPSEQDDGAEGSTAGDMTKTLLGIAIIIGGAGGYLLFKRRQQNTAQKSKKLKK